MNKKEIELKVSKGDPSVGYVYLPNHARGYGSVDKQISLFELIGK